jgi:hypothetical protein
VSNGVAKKFIRCGAKIRTISQGLPTFATSVTRQSVEWMIRRSCGVLVRRYGEPTYTVTGEPAVCSIVYDGSGVAGAV